MAGAGCSGVAARTPLLLRGLKTSSFYKAPLVDTHAALWLLTALIARSDLRAWALSCSARADSASGHPRAAATEESLRAAARPTIARNLNPANMSHEAARRERVSGMRACLDTDLTRTSETAWAVNASAERVTFSTTPVSRRSNRQSTASHPLSRRRRRRVAELLAVRADRGLELSRHGPDVP